MEAQILVMQNAVNLQTTLHGGRSIGSVELMKKMSFDDACWSLLIVDHWTSERTDWEFQFYRRNIVILNSFSLSESVLTPNFQTPSFNQIHCIPRNSLESNPYHYFVVSRCFCVSFRPLLHLKHQWQLNVYAFALWMLLFTFFPLLFLY